MSDKIIDRPVQTCPVFGAREELAIPTDMCLFFHTCSTCGTRLRPNAGDCCAFCSFGDGLCIPRQREGIALESEEREV